MIALATIALAGWITLSQITKLDSTARAVRHSQEVRLALERVFSTLKDAETGTRGYAVTRSDAILAPYFDAMKRLDAEAAHLTSLVSDDPEQVERSRELNRLMDFRVAALTRAVEGTQAGVVKDDPEEVAQLQLEGNARMDAVRAQVRLMQAAEERLLHTRLDEATAARRTTLLTAGSTTLLALALVLAVMFVDARSSRRVRKSEQWLSTTLESIGDAVIATDERGCVKYLNPVASQLTGWNSDDAKTRRLDEIFRIVSEGTGEAVPSPVDRVLREGTVVGLANHTLLISRDGRKFPIEDSGAPIKDSDGNILGVVLVFKDASSQRAAEEALAASEERLRLAIEGAGLGTWDVDLATDKIVFNAQHYRMLGLDESTPLTRETLREQVLAEDLEPLTRAVARSQETGEPYQAEYRIRRANDGSERTLSVIGRFMTDDEGKPLRLLGIVTDITERRLLEQRVRQSQKLDALGTLAGGIAHDFNNILSILRGNLLLIEADLPPDHPIAPAIAEMSRACNRARDLVRQILTFGRKQEQDRKVVDMGDVVKEVLQLLRSTIPANIDIKSRISPDLPTVLADPTQIHQVMMNLGINSSHAIGRASGTISVELDDVHIDASSAAHSPDLHEARYVRLRFGDSGSGMTRDVLDRIFEPFFTTKPQGTGTGLGLAVVRGIVKAHDGAITVYSEPGKGTQFNLYFPVVEGTTSTVSHLKPPPVLGEGQRILYIDDEDALVTLARRLLERLGYRVEGFSIPEAALAAFEANPQGYDLVLSDLSMPGLSGLDVAKRVLQIRPDIPVLLASGYVRNEDVELARSIGVREIIWKPATINEMGELLKRVLAQIMPA